MGGNLQEIRKFPKAIVEDLGVQCPRCAKQNTVVVSIGDPHGPEKVIEDTPQRTVTELSGISFAACEDCDHSWELEKS